MRYLLDENLPSWWRRRLSLESPNLRVIRVGDPGAPGFGTPDDEILRWLEENDFVLVTNNRRSLPGHLADHLRMGRHVPGIFVIDPSMNLEAIVEELNLIDGASFPGEYTNQIRFLPIG